MYSSQLKGATQNLQANNFKDRRETLEMKSFTYRLF